MLYDEFQAITIAPEADRLVLRERSLAAAAVRFVLSLVPLGAGVLVVAALLGPGGPRPAGNGLSTWLGWGMFGLFFTALGLLPIVAGICLIGLRSEYIVRQTEHRLSALARCIGLVIRSRAFSFCEFQQVCIRHVRRVLLGVRGSS